MSPRLLAYILFYFLASSLAGKTKDECTLIFFPKYADLVRPLYYFPWLFTHREEGQRVFVHWTNLQVFQERMSLVLVPTGSIQRMRDEGEIEIQTEEEDGPNVEFRLILEKEFSTDSFQRTELNPFINGDKVKGSLFYIRTLGLRNWMEVEDRKDVPGEAVLTMQHSMHCAKHYTYLSGLEGQIPDSKLKRNLDYRTNIEHVHTFMLQSCLLSKMIFTHDVAGKMPVCMYVGKTYPSKITLEQDISVNMICFPNVGALMKKYSIVDGVLYMDEDLAWKARKQEPEKKAQEAQEAFLHKEGEELENKEKKSLPEKDLIKRKEENERQEGERRMRQRRNLGKKLLAVFVLFCLFGAFLCILSGSLFSTKLPQRKEGRQGLTEFDGTSSVETSVFIVETKSK